MPSHYFRETGRIPIERPTRVRQRVRSEPVSVPPGSKITGLGGITDIGSASQPPGGFTGPDFIMRSEPTLEIKAAGNSIVISEIFDDLFALSIAGLL